MTHFPQCLAPTCEEAILLRSGSAVHLPKTTPQFSVWQHDVPFDRYGKKAVLDFRGEPLFAELVILRLFDEAGWSGVWVDTYRHCFRVSVAKCIEIPKDKRDQQRLVGDLRRQMFDAAAKKEFERAAEIRDTLNTIQESLLK